MTGPTLFPETGAETAARRIKLAPGEAHVWLWDGSPAKNPDARLALLDEGERARADRFAYERNRVEFIGAHALLRTALSRYADTRPEAWRFETEAKGRPVLADSSSGLHFSLSHAGGCALVAIARTPDIGVDLEALDRHPTLAEVERRVLSADERARWRALEGGARAEMLLACWTLKEAYSKALGLGLGLEFTRVGFETGDGEWRMNSDGEDAAPWRFATFAPVPGLCGALARGGAEALTWRLLRPAR